LETARSLKTLDEDVLKETIRYFTLNDPDGHDISGSSQENKNLVDNVIFNAELMAEGANSDKFNTKKRWWTP